MISDLGRLLVLIALASSAIGAVLGLTAGARRSAEGWARARLFAYVASGSMIAAVGLMEYALITHDFSVGYVAQVGSRSTPLHITIVSLWSSLEGSILFWGLVLATWTGVFARTSRDSSPAQGPYALGALLFIGVFFYFLVAGVANPFAPVDPVPADGPGPNPLLQNHVLMIIHPPALYLGFVGMSVPFAMAVAALLAGRLDAAWMRSLRRWTLVPWSFLTMGIMLGGWWSYEVLGWGGYWAWDPVENASFMPWLTSTAFLHSAMIMERKGHFKVWTLTLIMASFLLTILGTFMTRSGVFNSVHSFTQSDIGPAFLGFLALCLVGSVVLLAARMDLLSVPEGGLGGTLSRPRLFLFNNLLFVALTFTVLLGTVFPLLKEAITGDRISVGEPYFNQMTLPVWMGVLFLMGVGPALPWGDPSRDVTRRQLLPPLVVGLVVGGLSFAFGVRNTWGLATFALAGFALFTSLREIYTPGAARAKARGEGLLAGLWGAAVRARRRYAGHLVHLGVVVMAMGIAASSSMRQESDLILSAGESEQVGRYTLTFLGPETLREDHRTANLARYKVAIGDREIGELSPRLNHYPAMREAIGTPAVRTGLTEDLYLSLIRIDAKQAVVRVLIEPLVAWVWVGGILMFIGGLIAVWPARGASVVAPTRAAVQPAPVAEGTAK